MSVLAVAPWPSVCRRMMSGMELVLQTPARAADRYAVVGSPIGELLLTGNRDQLLSVNFPVASPQDRQWNLTGLTEDRAAFADTIRQLDEYFAGTRRDFDLPLAPAGHGFTLKVWTALLSTGYGRTVSYGEIARRLGAPGAARAVGSANHVNPIPIIIPCHRVVATTGIGGFSGGEGLPTKRALLALENPTAAAIWRENS